MIVSIPNQPIVFKEKDTESGACAVDQSGCQIVYQHDKICFQHKQVSCLPQMLCSPTFDSLGSELVTDGDFYSNPYGQGGWVVDENDWTWDESGKKLCINTGGGYSDVVYNLTLDPNCTALRVTFTVSDLTEGGGAILIVTLPDGTIQLIEVNGEYEYIVVPGPSITFEPEINFDGCIDDVSIKCVSECWDITTIVEAEDNGLTFNFPGICKTEGVAMEFAETNGTLTSGKYYQVWVDVGLITSGEVEFFLGGVSIGVITEEGVYPLYGTSGGAVFSFTMSHDFAGCINSVYVYQLSKDYTMALLTLNDNQLVEVPITYTKDLIEACMQITPEFLATFSEFADTKRNCWKLVIESPDDGELVTNGEFTLAQGETLLDFYDIQDDDNFQIAGVQSQAAYASGDGYLSQELAGLSDGQEYYISFDIVCYSGEANFDSFAMFLGADASNVGGTQVFDMDNYPQQVGHYVYKVVAGSDGNFISMYFTDDYGLTGLCITNLSVRLTPCPKETVESNCIGYTTSEGDDTKLITACNEEGQSMGFDWSTGFKIHGRIPAMIIGPRYAAPEDDTYLFSDSRRKRAFAYSEKKFDLVVKAVDEFTHDWIRAALKCDVLYIETGYALQNRYVCLDGEYVPQWERKTMPGKAESSVEIQRYDNVIFNTNCG